MADTDETARSRERTYLVTGVQGFLGRKPGAVFTAELDEAQERRALRRNSISLIADPPEAPNLRAPAAVTPPFTGPDGFLTGRANPREPAHRTDEAPASPTAPGDAMDGDATEPKSGSDN